MKIQVSGMMLLLILLVLSCGQAPREASLLDAMPAGHDIYLTFNPSEIDIDEVLSSVEEIVSQGESMPMVVSGMLGFDPFDWDGWTDALALIPDGEMGIVIDMDDSGDEPELIALFLSSDDANEVEDFFAALMAQADDDDASFLVTESEGFVVVAVAPSQASIDDFEESLGTLIDNDEEFNRLREKSTAGVPAVEIFAHIGLMSRTDEIETMLLSCFVDDSRLGFQILVRTLNMEAIESSRVVASSANAGSANIPSDATGAIRVSVEMDAVKELMAENMPPEAQMGVAMLGFESINDLFDAFSGDTYFSIRTDGSEFAGVIQYGLSNQGAIEDLLDNLSGMMAMSGQAFTTIDFQGSTCYTFEAEIAPGIDGIELGIVDNFLAVAGGYTLSDLADGKSFSDYLEDTGLGIEDEGGFVIVANLGELAEAFDLNEKAGNLVDFEKYGYFALTGNTDNEIFAISGAVDMGGGNPFVVVADAIAILFNARMEDAFVPSPIIEEEIPVEEISAPLEEVEPVEVEEEPAEGNEEPAEDQG